MNKSTSYPYSPFHSLCYSQKTHQAHRNHSFPLLPSPCPQRETPHWDSRRGGGPGDTDEGVEIGTEPKHPLQEPLFHATIPMSIAAPHTTLPPMPSPFVEPLSREFHGEESGAGASVPSTPLSCLSLSLEEQLEEGGDGFAPQPSRLPFRRRPESSTEGGKAAVLVIVGRQTWWQALPFSPQPVHSFKGITTEYKAPNRTP